MDNNEDPTLELWNVAKQSTVVDQRSWVNVSKWVPSFDQDLESQHKFNKPPAVPAPEFVLDTRFLKIKD